VSKPAHFRCLSCDHQWSQPMGGGKPRNHDGPPGYCPACGHMWMKWENYEEFKR